MKWKIPDCDFNATMPMYSNIDVYGHNAMFYYGEYKIAYFLRMQVSIKCYWEKKT